MFTYAHKTTHNNFVVYHSKPLDTAIFSHLHKAQELLKRSEYYNPEVKLNICLNDGSMYPALIEKFFGNAYAWGFYNNVVIKANINYTNNYVVLNGSKWNLDQLVTHEAIHCFQFKTLGLWKSNPVAKHPIWKWEGYPEYIARANKKQTDIVKNIDRLLLNSTGNDKWIQFEDSTGTLISYYKYWLLVHYCIDIKKNEL